MRYYLLIVLLGSCALSGCSSGGSSQQSIPPLPLTISTASLPNGTSEIPYSQTIQATGGVGPFSWTVSAGALPQNLTLSSSVTNTVTISGTPDAVVQAAPFTIEVTDSANKSAIQPYTVSIVLEPDRLTFSPSSLSFLPPQQLVGTTSAAQPVTLTNTGSLEAVVSNIALTGANAADFSQNNNCGSSVAAGANCTINVTFAPSQLGPRSASITITDNTTGSPDSVAVNGVGLTSGPNATLSATSLAFGNQVDGTTSPAQSITLSNYGTMTLSITGITASKNFTQTNTCSSTLATAANCTVSTTFTPSLLEDYDGTLSFADSAAESPQIASLSGSGVLGAGQCTPAGKQCPPQAPPCCAGLICSPTSSRSFCVPISGNASRTSSSADQGLADRLR